MRWHGPGAIIFAFFLIDPAAAQLAATAGFESDYRYRGYSLTDNHPALTAQLSYDDPSGFYGSVLGLQDLGNGARFLGAIGDVGYAKRLNDKVTIDGGVLRSQIRSATPGGLDFKYTEFYAGAYVGPVAGRIYYSPDYRTLGQSALYGELEAGFEPAPKWRVSGHVGLLKYLNTTEYWKGGESHRDWRFTVGRRIGKFEVHSALSGGGPTYYGPHHNPRLSVGGSFTF